MSQFNRTELYMTDHGSSGSTQSLRTKRKQWRRRLRDEQPEHYCSQCMSLCFVDDESCLDCGAPCPSSGWNGLDECEDPWLGRSIDDRYLISAALGHGSSGDVYRGESRSISRQFAVKIIATDRHHAQAEQVIERLEREIEALSRLRNPHIVSIYEILDLRGRFAAAIMDLIEGVTLEKLIQQQGPLSVDRACSLLRQTANGIYGAHQAGMIHRDLKPENLMVERLPAGDDFIHILDFGIVQLTDDTSTHLTHGFIGTPLYASPEQATAKGTDHRSDIYSLGAILFFMLTGQPPFPSDNVYEVLRMHVRQPPPRLDEVAPSRCFPEELQDLLSRMLAKQPDDRPGDLTQVIQELDICRRAFMAGPSTSHISADSTDDSISVASTDEGGNRAPLSGVLKVPKNFDPTAGYDSDEEERNRSFQSQQRPKSDVLKAPENLGTGKEGFERNRHDSSATLKAYDQRQPRHTPAFQRQPTPTSTAEDIFDAVPGKITFSGTGHESSGATAIPSATYQLRTPASDVEAAHWGDGIFAIMEQNPAEIRLFRSDASAPNFVPIEGADTIETIALNSSHLIAGHREGTVSKFDLKSGRRTNLYQDVRRTPICAVHCSANEACIVAGSKSGRVYMHHLHQSRSADWRRIRSGESVNSIAVSDNAEFIAVARRDNSVEIVNTATPRAATARFSTDAPVRSMSISPDNYLLAASLVDRSLVLFQIPTGRSLLSLRTEHVDVLAINFGDDANPVAVCSIERQIRLLKFDQINAHAT